MRKERDGARGANVGRILANGDGWRALDVVCTAGPHDPPFEERHAWSSLSIVIAGIFSYRSGCGATLMSPGAIMLGSFDRSFECAHHHGEGDRCLSFQFSRELFEDVARGAGVTHIGFANDRIPPLRALSPFTVRAIDAMRAPAALEEIALELAGATLRLEARVGLHHPNAATRDRIRIGEVIRHLNAHGAEHLSLAALAQLADLSRYHFLRTFRKVTGITPHQWILRARLREAAMRLVASADPITGIAFEVGFDDLSNFIRSFRAEFGLSPRAYRANAASMKNPAARSYKIPA